VQALLLVNAIGLAAFLAALGLVLLIGRRAAPWLAGMLTLALVLKSLLTWKPAWEAALFPWPDYIYLQGYWMTAIALAAFGTGLCRLWRQPRCARHRALPGEAFRGASAPRERASGAAPRKRMHRQPHGCAVMAAWRPWRLTAPCWLAAKGLFPPDQPLDRFAVVLERRE
jgi:hypothetical protein